MPKIKLTIIITRADIGGAQNYVLEMIAALKEQFDIELLVGSQGYLTNQVEELGIQCIIMPEIDSPRLIKAVATVRNHLAKSPPAILNTHSALASLYGRLASIRLPIKTVYSVHGWYFASNAGWLRRTLGPATEFLLRPFTDHWITETQYDQDLGIKKHAIPSVRATTVIPNGISEVKNRRSISLDNSLRQLVLVGRNSYQKNLPFAIEVMAALPSDYVLTVYCDNANDGSLLKGISSYRLEGRVRLVDDEFETATILQNYDLMLCTSRYEGMPLALIEAMAAGLPIVTTQVCGLSELVREGESGYLVNAFDAQLFASKVKLATRNKETIQKLGNNARDLFNQKHTVEMMTRSVVACFTQILKKKDAQAV